MTNCYLCGRHIVGDDRHVRRRVVTGFQEQLRYSKGKFQTYKTTYGMRVVCSGCAWSLDKKRAGQSVADTWKLVFALLVLAGVVLARWLGL